MTNEENLEGIAQSIEAVLAAGREAITGGAVTVQMMQRFRRDRNSPDSNSKVMSRVLD